MSYPVDVEIYLAKMSEALNDDLAHQHVFEDYGIEDFEMFDGLVMNEVTLMCLDNYNLTGDVELSEDQFVRAMEKLKLLWILILLKLNIKCPAHAKIKYSSFSRCSFCFV